MFDRGVGFRVAVILDELGFERGTSVGASISVDGRLMSKDCIVLVAVS